MKKLLITTAIAFSAIAMASADDSTTTKPMAPRPMPPVMTTGDATVDAQIKALRLEMETKIRAIQTEYDAKIKLAIGDRKPVIAHPDGSTTTPKDMKHDVQQEIKDVKKGMQDMQHTMMKDMHPNNGTTTHATSTRRFSDLFNLFKGYFGASVEADQQ